MGLRHHSRRAAFAAAVLALAAFATGDQDAGTRTIELSPAGDQAAPALSVSAVTTVAFLDAAGAPWPIASLHVSEGGPAAAREPSHPHVATLRSGGRRASGTVVAFLGGLAEPVHLAVSRDAPAAPRVRIRIAASRSDADRGLPAGDAHGRLDRADVEAVVRDYLLANPDVLREAMDPSRQLAGKVRALRGEIVGRPDVPAGGDAGGAVTVVEFFDYACGFCKRSLDAVRAALAADGVRVELREYPILGEGSARAARAALAADLQGRYLDAHMALMERSGGYGDDLPELLAAELGLDAARLRADMESPEVAELIAANRRLAGRLGVTGTPAFLFLGPESVEVSPGALDGSRMADLIASVR